jgi:hypothetical protein
MDMQKVNLQKHLVEILTQRVIGQKQPASLVMLKAYKIKLMVRHLT